MSSGYCLETKLRTTVSRRESTGRGMLIGWREEQFSSVDLVVKADNRIDTNIEFTGSLSIDGEAGSEGR